MLNYDEIAQKVEQVGIQVVTNELPPNLQAVYKHFLDLGYKIFIAPTFEELQNQTEKGQHILLLLPHLMDGYLNILQERRLKSLIVTTSSSVTSKFNPYIFIEVKK